MRGARPAPRLLGALWLLAAGVLPARAHAWAEPEEFDRPAAQGGGGGWSFTGSDATRGLDCEVCHLDAPHRVRVRVDSDPPLEDGWGSADAFTLRVVLEGEHAGLDRACDAERDASCNENAFALEVTDRFGAPAGRLCTAAPVGGVCPVEVQGPDDTVVLGHERRVARARLSGEGRTAWSVVWLPPAEGEAAVTLWAAAVDGNGGDGTARVAPADYRGDDVGTLRTFVTRAGAAGCRAAPGRGAGAASPFVGALLLALALGLARPRARRTAGRAACGAACGLAAAALVGCAPAPPAPPAPDDSTFAREILPILAGSCLGPACHVGPRPAGDLDLSSLEGLRRRPDAVFPYGPYGDGLLLLKSIGVAEQPDGLRVPHAGFVFPRRADERFQALERWVRADAPPLVPRGVPPLSTHLPLPEPPTLAGEVSAADAARFADEVEPFVQASCGATACHSGVGGSLWIRRSGDDRAVQNVLALDALLAPGQDPRFSPLLRKLVPSFRGGLPHAGGAFFADFAQALAHPLGQWVAERVGPPAPEDRSPEELFFAEQVQPVLVRAGCLFQNCHGPAHFSELRLAPGVLGEFPRADTRASYDSARAQLALGPSPSTSRLVRKALARAAGGLEHLAVPSFSDPEDPDLQVLLDWAALETAAEERARGLPAGAIGRVTGLVWVAAPPAPFAVRHPEQAVWGARLLWAPIALDPDGTPRLTGAPVDLSEDARAGRRADIRAPAVSYDGDRVAFSMRLEGEDDALLYEVDLATGVATRRTEPAGDCATLDLEPAYAPDGALLFPSSRACTRTPTGLVATHLYRLDEGSAAPRRLTSAPFQVYAPWVHADGKVHFSQWRGGGEQTPIFRMLLDGFEPRDHVGNRLSPEALLLGVRGLPDGREALVRQVPDAQVPLGELMVFSRAFGPPSDDPYRPPGLAAADLAGVHSVAPLPNGRLIVARAARTVDATRARPADVEVGLFLDALGDPTATPGPALVDEDGVWELWPAVVTARARPPHPPEARPAEQAQVLFHSVPLADSMFVQNARGRFHLDPRVAGLRVLEALPVPLAATPDPVHPAPIQRRAAETPLESDGSVRVLVPPDAPLRWQTLDADGLALRATLWYQSVRDGTVINHNTPAGYFDGFCGGCHGARNDPSEEPVTVDTVSGASFSAGAVLPPRDGAPSDGQPDLLGFVEDVAPVLAARCASCHGAAEPAGGLSLAGDPGAVYEALLAPRDDGAWRYVDGTQGLARASYLVEVLLGRELDAARDLPRAPHPTTALTDDERRRLTLWIDLGAARAHAYPGVGQ